MAEAADDICLKCGFVQGKVNTVIRKNNSD